MSFKAYISITSKVNHKSFPNFFQMSHHDQMVFKLQNICFAFSPFTLMPLYKIRGGGHLERIACQSQWEE